MAEMIFGVAGIVTGITGMVCTIIVTSRNKKKDDKSDGKQDGVILTELGYIKSGIDDIKHKQELLENKNLDFGRELTAVDASVRHAHKRLDKLEKYHSPN